jgi:LytR cell envelope-related transcriptional attenuator
VDLIEQVGAYVGLAAFLGLAILALLYFSQARDVRRLREWAGRAPERTGETGATQHYLPPVSIEQVPGATRKPLRERIRRIRRIHIPAPRYLALVAGAVVIIAGGTLGALQLIGEDESSGGGQGARNDGGRRGGDRGEDSRAPRTPVDPSQVTVAVLNGTTIAGLAAQVAEEARADGFTLGTVTNAAATDQERSKVLYGDGQKNAARAVADRLGIRSTGPVDPLSKELAGSFDVVVLVGADRSG